MRREWNVVDNFVTTVTSLSMSFVNSITPVKSIHVRPGVPSQLCVLNQTSIQRNQCRRYWTVFHYRSRLLCQLLSRYQCVSSLLSCRWATSLLVPAGENSHYTLTLTAYLCGRLLGIVDPTAPCMCDHLIGIKEFNRFDSLDFTEQNASQ